MDSIRKQLVKELGQKTLWSVLIFAALFVVLYVVEYFCPSLAGRLLQWHNGDVVNWAFIIGIPGSIFGTAYVLTITNPKNYAGFYLGVVMSVLLAIKFYMIGAVDQMILYLFIFVPFQLKSLMGWRRNTLSPTAGVAELRPKYLDVKGFLLEILALITFVALDFVLLTYTGDNHDLFADWHIKLLSGIVVAASFLANLLMIWQKNDAWMWGVIYSIAGIVLFSILLDPFLIVLNAAFLIINGGAHIAWIKMTQPGDFGWAKVIFRK